MTAVLSTVTTRWWPWAPGTCWSCTTSRPTSSPGQTETWPGGGLRPQGKGSVVRDCLPPCVSLVCPDGGLWGRGRARVGLCLSMQSSSYVPLCACNHDLDPPTTLPTFVLTCVVLHGLRMGRYLLRLRPETKEWIGHHLEQNLARSVQRCEKECRRRRADGPSLARIGTVPH